MYSAPCTRADSAAAVAAPVPPQWSLTASSLRIVSSCCHSLSRNNPKLSTPLAIVARETALHAKPRDKILRLYRHVQKQVPHILASFGIDEPAENVRVNIKKVFSKFGTVPLDPKIANMMVFKGQMELDEALAQWKTRTHIQKYVYDISSQPHLGLSKISETPMNGDILSQPEAIRDFLGKDLKGW